MRHWLPALILLAGCPGEEPEPLEPYDQPGSFTAGTLEGEAPGDGVTLPVTVWFPSLDDGDDKARYGGLLGGAAFTDVDPTCDTPHPVMVFSHGYGGIRWQSPFLPEHLATHGWVTVAPDHVGNTFTDGSVGVDTLILRRPDDVASAFDWLVAESEDPESPLYGCVDAEAGYAVSGHSFGGYTAFATGGATVNAPGGGTVDLSDDRVWAVLTLAPWNGAGALTDGTADIEVPVMTLGGDLDTTTPWEMVSGLHGHVTTEPRYLGEIARAGHFSFSPVACTIPAMAGNGCGDGYIPLDDLTALVQTAALAFFEEVRGTKGAIDELPAESDDLTWTHTP